MSPFPLPPPAAAQELHGPVALANFHGIGRLRLTVPLAEEEIGQIASPANTEHQLSHWATARSRPSPSKGGRRRSVVR